MSSNLCLSTMPACHHAPCNDINRMSFESVSEPLLNTSFDNLPWSYVFSQKWNSNLWRPQKCELVSTLTKGHRVGTHLYSFKVIVFLPQRKVPPRFWSESSGLSRLLSMGVPNNQTLYFRNREVDMFLSQTKM